MERRAEQSSFDIEIKNEDIKTVANFIVALVEESGPRKLFKVVEEARMETGIKWCAVKSAITLLEDENEIKNTWDEVVIRLPQSE